MRYKRILLISLLLLIVPYVVAAQTAPLDQRNVLIVYYGEDDMTLGNTVFLDATLSGLFQHVQLQSTANTTAEDLAQADIIVLYSATEVPITQPIFQSIATTQKELFVIGPAVTQLPQYQDWQFNGEVRIRSIEDKPLSYSMDVVNVTHAPQAKVLASGYHYGDEYPVILQQGKHSFSAITQFYENEKYVFTTSLYGLFDLEEPTKHLGYIRLEDVSPSADPQLVWQAGDYLLSRGIPVYIALIPVYLDPTTKKEILIDDVPQLKEVLDTLVKRGAMIISHGYTHTYRDDETGEGFEFWDSIHNQPITTVDWQAEPTILQQQQSFANEEQYTQYMAPFKEIEKQYIDTKLTNAIHQLTTWGYAPIGFEAPHYTMSSHGYMIASQYFNAIFGQIQISDKNWHRMTAPLLVSQPTILSGMTFYPETIGFVDNSVPNPMQEMAKKIEDVSDVPGAMLGGFYHPYLGIEQLKEMVALMEAVPNLEWLDMAVQPVNVTTPYVSITTNDGEIIVKQDLNWRYRITEAWQNNPGEIILWAIVIITALFVSLFLVHIATMRFYYRKRLFEERM